MIGWRDRLAVSPVRFRGAHYRPTGRFEREDSYGNDNTPGLGDRAR